MSRAKVVDLIKNSIREALKLEDYSTVYYKVQVADKYMDGGVFNSSTDAPNPDYLISYPDMLEFLRLYNEAIPTDERFNAIEIRFDKDMHPEATFTWDQAYYDIDLQGNKNLRKKKV